MTETPVRPTVPVVCPKCSATRTDFFVVAEEQENLRYETRLCARCFSVATADEIDAHNAAHWAKKE